MMDRSTPLRRKLGLARQRGQAMLEYALIGGALATAMFLVDYGGGRTGAQYLSDMIRAFFRNLTYYLSLP